MHIDTEEMGPDFTKHHIRDLPFPLVIHHFRAPDLGDPHDHPWSFRSTILSGGYTEQIYEVGRGLVSVVERRPGDTFYIEAGHIHRIVHLPVGECWTAIQPLSATVRKSGFYQFREDGTYHRYWDGDWAKMELG